MSAKKASREFATIPHLVNILQKSSSVCGASIQRKCIGCDHSEKSWGRRRALSAALLHIFRKELLFTVRTLIHTFLAVHHKNNQPGKNNCTVLFKKQRLFLLLVFVHSFTPKISVFYYVSLQY